MNRLVIIGNGFDMAHDLKTSYCDFITWYLESFIDKFVNLPEQSGDNGNIFWHQEDALLIESQGQVLRSLGIMESVPAVSYLESQYELVLIE